MPCAKLWRDLIVIFHVRATWIFANFDLWVLQSLVKWVACLLWSVPWSGFNLGRHMFLFSDIFDGTFSGIRDYILWFSYCGILLIFWQSKSWAFIKHDRLVKWHNIILTKYWGMNKWMADILLTTKMLAVERNFLYHFGHKDPIDN